MLKNPIISNNIGNLSSSQAGIGVLNTFIVNFITLAFGLSGLLLFAMLLWGGYEFIASGGDKEGTEKAKKRMTSALIGVCIVFSLYAILAIIQTLFGINLVSITVPTVTTP